MRSRTRLLLECALDIRFRLQRMLGRLAEQRQREQAVPLLDTRPDTLAYGEQERGYLQARLRQFPYWRTGHRAYVERCLEIRDFEAAFLSIKALEILSAGRPVEQDRALLARCYLQAGFTEKAETVYRELAKAHPDKYVYRENLAASLLALGRKQDAQQCLVEIPAAVRSAEAQLMLDACELPPEH